MARRWRRRVQAALAALLPCMTAMAHADGGDGGAAAARAPALRCTLQVAPHGVAGRPVPLRMTLHNPGARPLRVLGWQTPFEGWFAPFVALRFEGQDLPYQGPMMKRGAPGADDYLRLPARGSKSATVDLAQVFDLSRPGRYALQPRLRLFDVRAEGAADGSAMTEQPLDCPALQFELRAP